MAKPVAWSFSALGSFETCAFRHYKTKVKKDTPDPPGEAALWGQRVHKHLEERLRDGTPLPDSLAPYEKYASPFDKAPGTLKVENQIALTKDFKLTEWFAKDVWCRAVLDVEVINGSKAGIWDWKTGKRKPENDQLELFAGVTFVVHPEVERADTGFIWLQEKKIDKATFTRADGPRIWERFIPRVQRLERAHETDTWDKKPSGLCRKWCPVKSCEHNGQR